MSGTDTDIDRAQRRADRARERLSDALTALKQQLSPGIVARKVATTTKEKATEAADAGVEAVKARPAVAVGAAALAALFLARKPLIRALSSDDDETPPRSARSDREASHED